MGFLLLCDWYSFCHLRICFKYRLVLATLVSFPRAKSASTVQYISSRTEPVTPVVKMLKYFHTARQIATVLNFLGTLHFHSSWAMAPKPRSGQADKPNGDLCITQSGASLGIISSWSLPVIEHSENSPWSPPFRNISCKYFPLFFSKYTICNYNGTDELGTIPVSLCFNLLNWFLLLFQLLFVVVGVVKILLTFVSFTWFEKR